MSFDFDSVSAPFRMQPGLRRLAPDARQLTPNHLGDRALQEKLRVLGTHPEQALLAIDSFDSTPALRALAAHAAQEHPGAFSWDGGAQWRAHHLGWSLHGDTPVGDGPNELGACLRALPDRWRHTALIALAFAEDFAVIDGTSGRIPWLAVCLPSHWAPEDKIGRHFAQVHAPVADNRILIAASDHLARLVTGADRWELSHGDHRRPGWQRVVFGILGQHDRAYYPGRRNHRIRYPDGRLRHLWDCERAGRQPVVCRVLRQQDRAGGVGASASASTSASASIRTYPL